MLTTNMASNFSYSSSAPLVPELAAVLRDHRKLLIPAEAPGLAEGWVFPSNVGKPHAKETLRKPLKTALAAASIKRHFTQHGLRWTFNDLSPQIAGKIVTRSITGHVAQSMTEHYSPVGGAEKLAAAGQIVRLVLSDRSGDQGGIAVGIRARVAMGIKVKSKRPPGYGGLSAWHDE